MMNGINKVRWEITKKCNLNCSHCFIGDRLNNLREINEKSTYKVVDKLWAAGVRNISFTTKEPLLHPEIMGLLKYCSKLGINTNLVTNGTILADQEIAGKLIESELRLISISLEGISKESNDRIRGDGVLEKVIAGIENIKKAQGGSQNLLIGIQMSLNRLNYIEAEEIPLFFNKLPVNFLYIGDIAVEGNADRNSWLKLSHEAYSDACVKIIQSYSSMPGKNYYLVSKSLLPWETVYYNLSCDADYPVVPPFCGVLNNDFSIMPDGTLFPCISLYKNPSFSSPPAVNLIDKELDQMNLKTIQNYRLHLKALVDREKRKARCDDCYFTSKCYPCPASLTKAYFLSEIESRCQDCFVKINSFFKWCAENGDRCFITFRDGVFLSRNKKTLKIKRTYPNGIVSENHYYTDDGSWEEVERILEGPVAFRELIGYETMELIKKMAYDNYIKLQPTR